MSTFASLHSGRDQITLTLDSTSELIEEWSKHTTLFARRDLGAYATDRNRREQQQSVCIRGSPVA